MTKFVSHSDPAWAGKRENLDRWLSSEMRSLGVCVCVSLRSSAAHACAGEETCREEKKGDQGESKRGGQDRFHKGEARDELGMRIPEADNSLQHPGFTGFDALHIEGLFTLAVFPPGLKGCSGQGAWWPSSIFLGGLGSRARQGPK